MSTPPSALLLLALAFMAAGCTAENASEAETATAATVESTTATEPEAATGPTIPALTAIGDLQDSLAALDERAARFDYRPAGALARAEDVAGEYANLAAEARAGRTEGISCTEDRLWEPFLLLLELRVQAADLVVEGVRSGDFDSMWAELQRVNEKTLAANDRYNQALDHYLGEDPPGSD